MSEWYLYIVRTRNGHLYTGITIDVKRRFAEHSAGGVKAARYLRGRAPLTLVFSQEIGSRSAASKSEWAVKQLPKEDKEALVAGRLSLETLLTGESDRQHLAVERLQDLDAPVADWPQMEDEIEKGALDE